MTSEIEIVKTPARLIIAALVCCALCRPYIGHGTTCQNETTYNWTIEKTTRSLNSKDKSTKIAYVSIVDADGSSAYAELDNNTYMGEMIKHNTQLCLNDPVEMTIAMDGNNGWGLSKIVMVNDDTQQRFIFRCNCFIRRNYRMSRTEKTCLYPGDVNNVYAKMNGSIDIPKESAFTSNNSVEYMCKEGYKLSSGDSVRNCSYDGQWSGTAPVCSVITCLNPRIDHNALVLIAGSITIGSSTLFPKGSNITYKCTNESTLTSGNLLRICIGDNQWSGSPPLCSGTTDIFTNHTTSRSSSDSGHDSNTSTTTTTTSSLYTVSYSTSADTTSRHQSPIIESTTYTLTTVETSDAVTRNYSLGDGTSKPLPVIRGCRCHCSRVGDPAMANMTQVQINAAISLLKEELKVDKSKLSSTIRKKTCAKDDRPSAKAVGCVTGTVIFVIIGATLLIADANVLVKHFKILLRNVKGN